MNPTTRWLMRVMLLSLAFACATLLFGWCALAVLGAAWGLVGRGTVRPAVTAGFAAAIGWVILLTWSAATGPVVLLTNKLGGIVGAPGSVFIAATILLPFAVAFMAARVVRR